MPTQWKNFAFWTGAILLLVLATVFYQPASAKTGSLLVWTRERVYVMDIDTLDLARIGPAKAGEPITPSPGCFGQVEAPCWVVVRDWLYRVETRGAPSAGQPVKLPVEPGYRWGDMPVSWSPDGRHVAYSLVVKNSDQAELRVYNAQTRAFKIKAHYLDPTVAVAWSEACGDGLETNGCEIGFKQVALARIGEVLPSLSAYAPATGQTRRWTISPAPIEALGWTEGNDLLYSRPNRLVYRAAEQTPAYDMPAGAQFASLSPDGRYTVYYQPFKLKACTSPEEQACLYLGVWLQDSKAQSTEPQLIYSLKLSEQKAGLNFVPIWSPQGDAFVFFQEGRLIHYHITAAEATIWYKAMRGKLRSVPVFSPDEEAVAFVDNQGQGRSEYRLVIVNPRLKPIEHIIATGSGFRVLAWLPN
jgi:hypothetical protein